MIELKVNTTSAEQIRSHLELVDLDFTPPLHSYVNISEYAEKLAEKSFRIEAFKNESLLVGLLAGYFNYKEQSFFISNFSVVKGMQGKGVAKLLMTKLEELINLENGIHQIDLEIFNENQRAYNFYMKHGFKKTATMKRFSRLTKMK